MEKFAKIVELDDRQVLFYIEYDNEKDCTVFHQKVSCENSLVDIEVKFSGEQQEEMVRELLETMNKEKAQKLIDIINKEFGDIV